MWTDLLLSIIITRDGSGRRLNSGPTEYRPIPAARWRADGWGSRRRGWTDRASRTCELRAARPRIPKTPSRSRYDDVCPMTPTRHHSFERSLSRRSTLPVHSLRDLLGDTHKSTRSNSSNLLILFYDFFCFPTYHNGNMYQSWKKLKKVETDTDTSEHIRFYRAMLCIRGTSHGLCLSVCLSQVGVLLKWLNVRSHK